MQYCNVKMPLEMAYMDKAEDVRDLLGALVGPVDEWAGASTRSSTCGPYEEGDVTYSLDGRWWTLSYDFMDVGNDVARVFRYAIIGGWR